MAKLLLTVLMAATLVACSDESDIQSSIKPLPPTCNPTGMGNAVDGLPPCPPLVGNDPTAAPR